jgi:hypothetical protein
MAAEALAPQAAEDVRQRAHAELARGPRRQLEMATFSVEVAGLGQGSGELAQLLKVVESVVAGEVAKHVGVDLVERVRVAGGSERLLHRVVLLLAVNGRIRADEIQGAIDATTSNGGIDVRLAKSSSGRPTRLQTTNGGVELALEVPIQNAIEVSTSNGGITLRLPDKLGARVDASTSNSSITSEFNVQAQGEITKRRLQGTIGAGGPSIQLSTTNGSIRLLKL